MRQRVGDHSILKDRRGGTLRALTLRQLRERIEGGGQFDQFDFGGCGCALDEATPTPATLAGERKQPDTQRLGEVERGMHS